MAFKALAPPPLSSLMAVETLAVGNIFFSLMARSLQPPPLYGTASKKITFFCGFPNT